SNSYASTCTHAAQIATDSSLNGHELASLSGHSRSKNYLPFLNSETYLRKTTKHSPLSFRVFHVFPGALPVPVSALHWSGFALLIWLLLAEAVTETWYRSHEFRLPAPLTWTIAVPAEATDLEEKNLSSKARQ